MADLILPMVNKKVSLFRGMSELAFGNIRITQMPDSSDNSEIFKYAQDKKIGNLLASTKWVYMTNVKPPLRDQVVLTEFLFNAFKKKNAIHMPWYFVKEGKRLVFNQNSNSSITNGQVAYAVSTEKKTFESFYGYLYKAYGTTPRIVLTLERFNWALGRSYIYDKIIDLSIAMESLLPGGSELSYRLAVYCAIITQKSISRVDVFEKVKEFYTIRSKVVHGASDNKNKCVYDEEEKWNMIVDIAKKFLFYYVMFCATKKRTDWDNHLLHLTLGTEKLITE